MCDELNVIKLQITSTRLYTHSSQQRQNMCIAFVQRRPIWNGFSNL